MLSFLPEWVPAMEVDGDSDLRLAGWEDADPIIRMVIVLSFVFTLFPKTISVKIDWFDIPFQVVDWPQFFVCDRFIGDVLLWFTLSPNLLNSSASAVFPI